jgi:chemotaxis protein MotA
MSALISVLRGSRYSRELYLETLALLYRIVLKIRHQGRRSVENDLEDPGQSRLFRIAPKVLADRRALEFITDYLRLMASGTLNAQQIETLMDLDIETYREEGQSSTRALRWLGHASPGVGLGAAVLGVANAMDLVGMLPAEPGRLMAAVLLGTFLGIGVGYGLIAPLAGWLERRLAESVQYYQSLKVGLLACLNGHPPPTAVELARKALFAGERPEFLELERLLKGLRQEAVERN